MLKKVSKVGGSKPTQTKTITKKSSGSSKQTQVKTTTKSRGSSKESNINTVKQTTPAPKPKNVDKVEFGKPKPTVDTGVYHKPKLIAAATGRDPEPSKKKEVDLNELDKRIERRTKYPTFGEKIKDKISDGLEKIPGVNNAKHIEEKLSHVQLEEQVGRSLDYKTPQEEEETIKYATEVAGDRLGWSKEKTEKVSQLGPNLAPRSSIQLGSETTKVLKEIEDKKDERTENGGS